MKLLLARHGQTEWNAAARFQGHTDIGLSERGRAQAHALGRALRGRPVTAAYVSPMRRAIETAEIALADAGILWTPIEELRELSLGQWEGCTVDEIRQRDGDPYAAWLRAPLDNPPPDAEPLPVVRDRVLTAVERIAAAHGDGEALVIAHGGVISVYACHLLGCSFNHLWRLRVDNCSLTIVRPPRLVTLNDTRHLPADLQTHTFNRGERASPAPTATDVTARETHSGADEERGARPECPAAVSGAGEAASSTPSRSTLTGATEAAAPAPSRSTLSGAAKRTTQPGGHGGRPEPPISR
jgi:broad specificity phosphatase PhoE